MFVDRSKAQRKRAMRKTNTPCPIASIYRPSSFPLIDWVQWSDRAVVFFGGNAGNARIKIMQGAHLTTGGANDRGNDESDSQRQPPLGVSPFAKSGGETGIDMNSMTPAQREQWTNQK